jgi:mRNA interferase RelE/StbE
VYEIEVSPAAERDLKKLVEHISGDDFDHIKSAINGLSLEPRPNNVRKIRGTGSAYRIRVGNYRVIYDLIEKSKVLVILHVIRRSEDTYHI